MEISSLESDKTPGHWEHTWSSSLKACQAALQTMCRSHSVNLGGRHGVVF